MVAVLSLHLLAEAAAVHALFSVVRIIGFGVVLVEMNSVLYCAFMAVACSGSNLACGVWGFILVPAVA